MALLVKEVVKLYINAMTDFADPRTKEWFMVKSPIPTLFLLVVYLYIVKEWGPDYMKHRKPIKLDTILKFYNVLQVILCSYICIKSIPSILKLDHFCAQVDYSLDSDAINLAETTWLYQMSKYLDLLDTVFFVLKKNEKQISFLHVYHHFNGVLLGWFLTKYLAGGHTMYLIFINSFVHVCMYSYYLLSVNQKGKNIAWKKTVTLIQFAQFGILFIIYLGLLINTNCNYPKFTALAFLPQDIFMIVLFSDFYYKSYCKKIESTN